MSFTFFVDLFQALLREKVSSPICEVCGYLRTKVILNRCFAQVAVAF